MTDNRTYGFSREDASELINMIGGAESSIPPAVIRDNVPVLFRVDEDGMPYTSYREVRRAKLAVDGIPCRQRGNGSVRLVYRTPKTPEFRMPSLYPKVGEPYFPKAVTDREALAKDERAYLSSIGWFGWR
jgi:hypothetical protein